MDGRLIDKVSDNVHSRVPAAFCRAINHWGLADYSNPILCSLVRRERLLLGAERMRRWSRGSNAPGSVAPALRIADAHGRKGHGMARCTVAK